MLRESILKHNPSKIVLVPNLPSVVFYINEEPKRLNVGDLDSLKADMDEIMQLPNTFYREETDRGNVVHFIWGSKEERLNTFVTKVGEVLITHDLLDIFITTQGTFVNGTKSKKLSFNWKCIEEYVLPTVNSSAGEYQGNFDTSAGSFNLSVKKVDAFPVIRIRRRFPTFENFRIRLSTEFKDRAKNLGGGIIVTSLNEFILFDHIKSTLRELDPNAMDLTCVLIDEPSEEIFPRVPLSDYRRLVDLHFKYAVIPFVDSKEHLDIANFLATNGMIVVIAFQNKTIYGDLISLLSLIGTSQYEISLALANYIGLVHANVNVKGSEISIEDTETITITEYKISEICSEKFSKQKFDSFIEHHAKVFKLSKDSSGELSPTEEFNIMLQDAILRKASDIHIAVGTPIKLRDDSGSLVPYSDVKITPDLMRQIVPILVPTEAKRRLLDSQTGMNLPYSVPTIGRFRVQMAMQRGTYACVIRHTDKVANAQELGIPKQVVNAVTRSTQGLIIVTGPTGSGKSTTSASLIDALKQTDNYSITSLADPIEFVHSHGAGIVYQREIPSDVPTFQQGLTEVFRMDPDIVEIGEMRGLQSIDAVMRLGTSGHLVITTFHTNSVIATINTLVNEYPPEKRNEIFEILSQQIVAIVSQKLIEGVRGKQIPIFEYLIPTSIMRTLISQKKLPELESQMKTEAEADKSNASWSDFELAMKVSHNLIARDTALMYANDKDEFIHYLSVLSPEGN